MNAPPPVPAYAELQVTSNYSFLRGASHPDELVLTAAALGLAAVAITDRNSLAGVVRAHVAAKRCGIRLLVGARLVFQDAPDVLCFPGDRAAYGRLTRLLTLGKRRAVKGDCHLWRADLLTHGEGQLVVALPPADAEMPELPGPALPQPESDAAFVAHLRLLRQAFGDALYLAVQNLYRGDDTARLARLGALADALDIPLLATNDVYVHSPARRPLQDVLTCIRHGCTITQAGSRLAANAERHLKSPAAMAALFRARPDAVARTLELAARCGFSLDSLRYEYPADPVPDGRTAQQQLVHLTWEGAARRYPGGVPDKVRVTIEHEFALIDQLGYAPYFLTVHDIVCFARGAGILCQGRGSAANSAVCYCLGITAVDPARIDLLFERFVSAARNEPPDIDVDFEHERREEVIQYIYKKYGRERAGLTATVISYRSRSAVRDVGKAMGLSLDTVGALCGAIGWNRHGLGAAEIREAGFDPADPTLAQALALARELKGFPRHLSQHVGGFVITRGPLSEVVPIENAAMIDRTVIEWDKDDLDALGILKIDVLALGMLSCVRKAFQLLGRHYRRALDLASVPAEDPAVYAMLGRADSIGVFQVESRAQMTMLPRLQPRQFYDLVIEVAIVRPGPIQGGMVHPYLRRRSGQEKVAYPSPALAEVLKKTLGVPLFQEQAMRIAIVAAGFTPEEADRLRRAMATFRHSGTIQTFRDKLVEGMVARGYARDFAERCFRQIEGFGEYGFPESHAASFALLVYVSAWLKCHYPAAFAAALLNSQPMGFYAPAQIVRDAREHGVDVRPVDINHSHWDCTLEPRRDGVMALRLGFRQIKGLRESDMTTLAAARAAGYDTVRDLWRRTGLPPAVLERLAHGDAFASLGLDRRAALWQVRRLGAAPLPLFAHAEALARAASLSTGSGIGGNGPPAEIGAEPAVTLPRLTLGEQVVEDYAALRLSLKRHPLALLRSRLTVQGVLHNGQLAQLADGCRVSVAGLVLVRQQPGTASGVIFVTLEDESGIANIVVWPKIFERDRRALLAGRLLKVTGKLQREGLVVHVIADRLIDLSPHLADLPALDGRNELVTLRPVPASSLPDPQSVMPEGRNFR